MLHKILDLEVWVVAGAVALSVVSPRLLWLPIAAGLVFYPLRWAAARTIIRRTPGDWGVLLVSLLIPVTLWATALPELTQPQVLRLLSGILLYYAVINSTSTIVKLKYLLGATLVAGVGLAGFALVSVQWKTRTFQFHPCWDIRAADAGRPGCGASQRDGRQPAAGPGAGAWAAAVQLAGDQLAGLDRDRAGFVNHRRDTDLDKITRRLAGPGCRGDFISHAALALVLGDLALIGGGCRTVQSAGRDRPDHGDHHGQ